MKKQVVLIVLDGWGHREDTNHNAIAEARTPFFNSLWERHPHTTLDASGEEVGLPGGQIGNSEVGHMTIGAGKVIDTDLLKITKAMRAGEFGTNPAITAVFDHVKKNGSTLHLMGLASHGGVHSHAEHLHGLLRAAKEAGIESVAIHAFTDGRDTPPQSGHENLAELERLLAELGIGFIATASGRFYAMDRDNNWDRLAKAEAAIFAAQGTRHRANPSEILKKLYADGIVDEHLEPVVFEDSTGKTYTVSMNDGVLFFNFRSDRARMLAKKIEEQKQKLNLAFATMTQYDATLASPAAFAPGVIETTLAKEFSQAGLTQAHIAETEKYAHATYFLNGGVEIKYPGEEHVLIESRKDVPTHDLAPKMRAQEIADAAIEHIKKGTDFIFINFANSDMVGHTANKPAIVEAVEEVDAQLARVITALAQKDGVALITADHGNAEVNIDHETGEKHTAHTMNPVPAIITTLTPTKMRSGGGLADIAPTILSLADLPIPAVMTGKSLIENGQF